MAVQLTPEMLISIPIFLISAPLAGYGVIRYVRGNHQQVVLAFIILTTGIALWQIADLFIHGTTVPQTKLLVYNAVNAVVVPITLYSVLWFALAYSDATKRYIRAVLGLLVAHILVLVVGLTINPEFLYIVDGTATLGPLTIQNMTLAEWVVLDRTVRPLFRIYQLYHQVIVLISALILARHTIQYYGKLAVGQMLVLFIGIGAPLIVNVLFFAGVFPPELNPTSISLGVLAVGLAIAVFRYQILDLTRIGRDQFVEGMDDPLVFVNDANEVVYSNPSAQQVFNVESSWKGNDAADFFGQYTEYISPSQASDSSSNRTIKLDNADRDFDVKNTTIQTPVGEPGGKAIVLRDITELKKTNQRLDQFASIVSHDLRTPLNNAMVQTTRLEREYSDERTEAIQNELDQMESMIDEMLHIARAGTSVERVEEFPLEELVEEVWETLQTDDAELDCRLGNTTIEADPVRLFQALENLLQNALDHNPRPLTVRVGTLNADNLGDDASKGIYIEDTGDGFPAETRDRVFHHGYTTTNDGHGYGLTVVQHIVEAHDWMIHVTSGVDGGARFEIRGIETQ